MAQRQPIPTFYLYGEPHRTVGDGFLHVEALDDRSRPSEWTIKPHAHAELCHIILIAVGGGSMRADDRDIRFDAPCLLIVPAMTVHGFAWIAESRGTVITMSIRYSADLARYDEAIARLFDRPGARPLGADDSCRADRMAQDLVRELGWSAPGHRAAVDSTMLALLVVALRNGETDSGATMQRGHHAAVVARLRERIEQRYRLRESIADHAVALGMSQSALRVACLRVARMSPARMLDERALLEARRSLLYSNLSVSEIAYSLGFSDPAYFSRFFNRHTGLSPRAYREAHRASFA
jgi:AraC family transcriptional regulator, transcriptional activator of pobA